MNSDATKTSGSFDASEVVELLRNIEERLAAAWVEGDRQFIEQLLADDWSVTDLPLATRGIADKTLYVMRLYVIQHGHP